MFQLDQAKPVELCGTIITRSYIGSQLPWGFLILVGSESVEDLFD